MALKIKPLLLKCDFVGFIPHFRILNEFRYKLSVEIKKTTCFFLLS